MFSALSVYVLQMMHCYKAHQSSLMRALQHSGKHFPQEWLPESFWIKKVQRSASVYFYNSCCRHVSRKNRNYTVRLSFICVGTYLRRVRACGCRSLSLSLCLSACRMSVKLSIALLVLSCRCCCCSCCCFSCARARVHPDSQLGSCSIEYIVRLLKQLSPDDDTIKGQVDLVTEWVQDQAVALAAISDWPRAEGVHSGF